MLTRSPTRDNISSPEITFEVQVSSLGILVPLLLILTNSIWNYTSILLTMLALVWIGFALVLLTPSSAEA